jgi:hypothetical protein
LLFFAMHNRNTYLNFLLISYSKPDHNLI